jgi:hypothetical protein
MDNNLPNSIVSSNALFHFTDNIDHLLGILRNNFRPRYCLEIFEDSVGERIAEIARDVNFAVPMVCFCDIPLSLTARHLATYGHYGLGLTKEWGMRNGLSPLLYCHAKSSIIDVMGDNSWTIDFLKDQEMLSENTEKALDRVMWNIAFLSCFMKPYEGSFHRKGKLIKDVRFYNEREWRFVPQFSQEIDLPSVVYRDHAENAEIMEAYNQRLYECDEAALEFTPNDVRYIVVKYESELLEVEAQIEALREQYSESERRLLKTRLISSESFSDF